MRAVLEEVDELDGADDREDQRQPHVGADGAGLHLPVQDEAQDRHTDHEIHGVCGRHGEKANPARRGVASAYSPA
ncbi:MAG: hypothetical protein ACRDOL_31190 [Streptosporangiaceae bacterium]